MDEPKQLQLNIFEIYALAAREHAQNPPEYSLPGGEYIRKIDVILKELNLTEEVCKQACIPELSFEEKQERVKTILKLEKTILNSNFPAEERSLLREKVEKAFAGLSFNELKKVLNDEKQNEYALSESESLDQSYCSDDPSLFS